MAARPLLRFMAWPRPSPRARMLRTLADAGLDRRLGPRLFAPALWHQSLSLACEDGRISRERMLGVGSEIAAAGFTMTFECLGSRGGLPGNTHWVFRPRGDVRGFRALTGALHESLARRGGLRDARPTPHVTVSYRAPCALPAMTIAPIDWTIDEVHLVARHDDPFRYETLASWPLAATPRSATQPSLPF